MGVEWGEINLIMVFLMFFGTVASGYVELPEGIYAIEKT